MNTNNSDPENSGNLQGQAQGQAHIVPAPVPPVNNSQVPPLVGQNTNTELAPGHTRISNVIVPEVGDTVWVFNEPGQRAYVYRAEVVDYPFRIDGRPRYEFVNVRVLEYLQPSTLTGALRQRLGTTQMVRRKFLRYFPRTNAAMYPPMPEENYQVYLDALFADVQDPPTGGKRSGGKRSGGKKSGTKKRKIKQSRKKSKKSKKSSKRKH